MTVKDIYKVWAPDGCRWVEWVRPVCFVALRTLAKEYAMTKLPLPGIAYGEKLGQNMAVLVDLPGDEGVRQGIALAKKGYRPVPIYNGTIEQPGARATVDNQSVAMALKLWSGELKEIKIKKDAPPAFLTDKNRLNMYKMNTSFYDNSWDVYPQDLPSAHYLNKQGIKGILVVSKDISRDIKLILKKYIKHGINIYITDGYGDITQINERDKILRKSRWEQKVD